MRFHGSRPPLSVQTHSNCRLSCSRSRRLVVEPLEERALLAVLFVDGDASGSGSGESWDDAFVEIQPALDRAAVWNADADDTNDVSEIWIAEGTYTPTALLESGEARSASFSLVDGVTLFGGFGGGETALEGRDWSTHVTVLSGDLGTLGDDSDNATTVVYCGEEVEAAVDGVSITGGNADYRTYLDPMESRWGGGVFNRGTLTIRDSRLTRNAADSVGGGICCYEGSLTVINSMVAENTGSGIGNYHGTVTVADCTLMGNNGGIYSTFGTVTAANCTLTGNNGCGITNDEGDLTVTNSEILRNGTGVWSQYGTSSITDCVLADNKGSGISCSDGVQTVTNSAILRNTGGGIRGSGTVTVTKCDLTGNKLHGIENSSGTLTVTNSRLVENETHYDGGGILNKGTLIVTNSTIVRNSAQEWGGGIWNSGTLTITSSTIAGNTARQGGGGLCLSGGASTATLSNTLVADNGASYGHDLRVTGGTISGSHNLIGNGYGQSELVDGVDGNQVGTIYEPIDALLSDWTQFDDGEWGFHVLPGSPVIDAGDNQLAVDPAGDPLALDIRGNSRIHGGTVDIGAVEGTTMGSPGREYTVTSLEKTIAEDGVLTFLEAFEASNRNQPVGDAAGGSFSEQDTIQFSAGVSGAILLDDGELSILGNLAIEGPGAGQLTFDGAGEHRVATVWPGASASLNGVAITGGSAYYGGGILSHGALIVTNSTVFGNSADHVGGGIYCSGSLTITNSFVAGNICYSGGAGIHCAGSLTVNNSTITRNSARGNGAGGIGIWGAAGHVLNNTLVAENGAYNPDITVANGTVSGFHNLIGDGSGQSRIVDGANGNQVGTSSAPIDPLLSDWTQFDNGQWGFHLLPGSPALDAGDNQLALDPSGNPLVLDARGHDRIQGGTVDIGAVEGETSGNPAQDYRVTSLEETIAADGVLTFVEAFEAANRNQPVGDAAAGSFSEQDTIQFADGVSGTILLDEGELSIAGDLVIEGPGDDLLTFDGVGRNRVFHVWPHVSAVLGGMTITGGLTITGGVGGKGSGILNDGELTVTDASLSENHGPGISNNGTLTVRDSTLARNESGIGNARTLTVINSNISENYYSGIGSWGSLTVVGSTISKNYGHGISSTAGEATVTDSAIIGNRGGIWNNGILAVVNSTIARNSGYNGAGIGSAGALRVTNSTIVENWTSGDGGGIHLSKNSSTVILDNTIVAGNKAESGPDIYDLSDQLSGSHNLIGDGSGQSALTDGVDGNQVGTSSMPIDPLLSDLTRFDNGLWGVHLFVGSPAHDAGDNLLALDAAGSPLTQDIRGNGRIQDGTVDIGAVEGVISGSPGVQYTVTSLEKTIADDGVLTFLEAFEAANRNQPVGDAAAGSLSGQDTIQFAEGVSGTILLDEGELSIVGNLVIEGPGTDLLTVDASGKNRGFGVWPGVSAIVGGMTVTGGSAPNGGGIHNHGTLTVTNLKLSDNSAVNYGGGIYNSGALTIENSTLVENSSGFNGGGVFSDGQLTVTDSALAGNSAANDGGAILSYGAATIANTSLVDNSADEEGGGVWNRGTLSVTDSTLTGNSCDDSGGGIYNCGSLTIAGSILEKNSATRNGGGVHNTDGVLTVASSTISENQAGVDGGGIRNSYGGTLSLTNCTFSKNSAGEDGGGISAEGMLTIASSTLSKNVAGANGGGIRISGSSPTTSLDNTIVAGNTASFGLDIIGRSAGSISGSHNLIGSGSSVFIDGVDGNQVGTLSDPIDPLLSEWTQFDNGLWGYYLRAGSPALDAGTNDLLPADEFDLDGDGDTSEPVPLDLAGNPRIEGGVVDIGACESSGLVNNLPWANAGGPYLVGEGGLVGLDGSASSDPEQIDNTTLTYQWDLDYDGSTFDVDATGIWADFSALAIDGPATRTVALRVTNDGGFSDTATAVVEVTNVAPTIIVEGGDTVSAGAEYTLTLGAITDPGDDTVTLWTVHWGDGLSDTYAGGGERTHVYEADGAYTVTVDLTDEDGTHTGAGSLYLTVGPVDFLFWEHMSLDAGSLSYPVETTRDGMFTLQVDASSLPGSARLRLYDADPAEPAIAASLAQSSLASATSTLTPLAESVLDEDGNHRIDWTVVAGETYYVEVYGDSPDFSLRIANLVEHDGTAVTVHGTDEGDVFVFSPTGSRQVTINGVAYHFDDAEVATIDFTGGDGFDEARLYDSAGDEILEAWPDHAVLTRGSGAGLADYTVHVTDIDSLLAYATRGGNDTATLHGSAGSDKLKSYEDSLRLRAKDSSYALRAKRFGTNVVDGGAAGSDLAVFNGTDGSETFTYSGVVNTARVEGVGRDHSATGFGVVVARAGGGDEDVVHFVDTAADDVVYFKSHKTVLVSPQAKVTVRAFDEVHATASEGGYDVARFYDTGGDDHLEVIGDSARLYRRNGVDMDLIYEALGFERVKAYSSEGDDSKDIQDHSLDLLLYGWDE